jgi:hypothetical protein
MVDNPEKAMSMLVLCRMFITSPADDMRSDQRNFTLDEFHCAQNLPPICQPIEKRFPCEIGKFLMKKLTYAPEGLDACKELMYHYDAYDLQKIQESLNEAIVTNHPDIINKRIGELAEILENTWNDKAIPRRIQGLQVGIPLSIAALGSVAGGPIGALGGFLAGLGFEIGSKVIDLETEGLSERLAKLKTRSYQANIFDFKRKYRSEIVQSSKKGKDLHKLTAGRAGQKKQDI